MATAKANERALAVFMMSPLFEIKSMQIVSWTERSKSTAMTPHGAYSSVTLDPQQPYEITSATV
jgi:hypothetical protein